MTEKTVQLSLRKYDLLRKAKLADDVLLQLELSLEDLRAGRVKRVR